MRNSSMHWQRRPTDLTCHYEHIALSIIINQLHKNSKIAPPVDADKVIISTDDKKKDSRTMYDFSVPIAGKDTKISDIVGPNAKAVLASMDQRV